MEIRTTNDCQSSALNDQMEWLLTVMEPAIGKESGLLARHARIPAQEAYDELRQEWTLCIWQQLRKDQENFR